VSASGPVPVGIAFTPFETRVDVLVDTARSAERRGFAGVSVAEAMTLAAPVVLTQLALATERLELSSAVLSVWTRTPATLAMTAGQLATLTGGRFVLGLGASTPPLVEGFHGVQWQDPLGTMRRALTAVRALLAGERLPAAPDGARPLRLALPPAGPVPVGLASITPPGIRLAGELADRWLPFLLPAPALDHGRELLAQAARAAGRDQIPTVTAYVPVALGPDEDSAARTAARWLTTYCTQMGPVYPRVLREWGYAAEIDALIAANTDPRAPVLPAGAVRLAREVLLFGTFGQASAAMSEWRTHADRLALTLPFALAHDDLADVVEALAEARGR
jgi:alkanesulfonate monooxygenase SsuD/methylene tetrahydromethanopterin reductase-like flavin-dependent oxidoreductase (luciferase family)